MHTPSVAARLAVIDFGSQTTQLIARRVRELGVACELHPPTVDVRALAAAGVRGFILSGGPASVGDVGAPRTPAGLWELGLPVLGICYGQQLMAHELGGEVKPGTVREFGPGEIELVAPHGPLARLPRESKLPVWMSHGDHVSKLPPGFLTTARSEGAAHAGMSDPQRKLHGVQFHPEVAHTRDGAALLAAFVFGEVGLERDWSMGDFSARAQARIREQVGEHGTVVCALSGGVDSAVCAVLIHRAIGARLHCLFVDNGLLREGESDQVFAALKEELKLPVERIDARARFLGRLAGITDPEEKRKRIGREFIAVFEEAARPLKADFLAQGTLYPDVIESVSSKGPSAVIKSHHNVGGLPEHMKLALIEPLRELFKDEVRALGRELAIPMAQLERQPFPGPGLAIRCLGEVTETRLSVLRRADAVVRQEIEAAGLAKKVWQGFAVLLPVRSVGVMGDGRTYDEAIALRVVESSDGMTADWARLPWELVARISTRITNEVRGVNRVVFDVTAKPPGTIEWE